MTQQPEGLKVAATKLLHPDISSMTENVETNFSLMWLWSGSQIICLFSGLPPPQPQSFPSTSPGLLHSLLAVVKVLAESLDSSARLWGGYFSLLVFFPCVFQPLKLSPLPPTLQPSPGYRKLVAFTAGLWGHHVE